jgi:hypothetical protein
MSNGSILKHLSPDFLKKYQYDPQNHAYTFIDTSSNTDSTAMYVVSTSSTTKPMSLPKTTTGHYTVTMEQLYDHLSGLSEHATETQQAIHKMIEHIATYPPWPGWAEKIKMELEDGPEPMLLSRACYLCEKDWPPSNVRMVHGCDVCASCRAELEIP